MYDTKILLRGRGCKIPLESWGGGDVVQLVNIDNVNTMPHGYIAWNKFLEVGVKPNI